MGLRDKFDALLTTRPDIVSEAGPPAAKGMTGVYGHGPVDSLTTLPASP
jgi:hypothetical protein